MIIISIVLQQFQNNCAFCRVKRALKKLMLWNDVHSIVVNYFHEKNWEVYESDWSVLPIKERARF